MSNLKLEGNLKKPCCALCILFNWDCKRVVTLREN